MRMCSTHANKYYQIGQRALVDATAARNHLRMLLDDYRWGFEALSAELGGAVSDRSLRDLAGGVRTRITRRVSDTVLAMPARYCYRDAATVPALGMIRRAQALAALGWSYREQCRQLGWYENRVHNVVSQQGAGGEILLDTHIAHCQLYDELCMRLGPDPRKDYPPPLSWDEGALDDPLARPHFAKGPKAAKKAALGKLGGKLDKRDYAIRDPRLPATTDTGKAAAVVRELIADGYSQPEIGKMALVGRDGVRSVLRQETANLAVVSAIEALAGHWPGFSADRGGERL